MLVSPILSNHSLGGDEASQESQFAGPQLYNNSRTDTDFYNNSDAIHSSNEREVGTGLGCSTRGRPNHQYSERRGC